MSHARRPFFDLYEAHKSAVAKEALERFAALYAIEEEIRGRSAEERRAVRNERSKPLLESLKQWFEETLGKLSKKSDTTRAIHYSLDRWEALTRYTTSGYLAIDNNVSEQRMKTIAIGRKNWLFTGSENGGRTMAVLFSVVSSCQRNGHDPFVYLRDVLTRLPDQPKERLVDLLPDRWTPLQASNATPSTISPGVADPVD